MSTCPMTKYGVNQWATKYVGKRCLRRTTIGGKEIVRTSYGFGEEREIARFAYTNVNSSL